MADKKRRMAFDGTRRPCVGVDFHTFDGIFQGSRSHILGLYAEAIQMAPEIDFVFLLGSPEQLTKQHPEFDRPNVRCVKVPHSGGIARLGWELAIQQRRQRLDLLHVQYRMPFVSLCECACTVHDTLFETHPQYFSSSFVRMARLTGRRSVRDAAILLTVSEFSRQEMSRLYGIDPADITITTNGVDRQRFNPGEEGADFVQSLGLTPGHYFCTIGRLEPRKNHLNLLRAYAKLAPPRPPLVVIGQPDHGSQSIFRLAADLGIANEVWFLQNVPDVGVPRLLRHATAFVYPSFAEGFGMPVAEAMACGVATVTSSNTALQEVAGDAALTVDPYDPDDIALALQRLNDDAPLRAELARRGLARIERFTWRASANALVLAFRNHFFAKS